MICDTIDVFEILRNDEGRKQWIPDINKYLDLKIRIKNLSADIFFAKRCLRHKVLPVSVQRYEDVFNDDPNLKDIVCRKILQFRISGYYRNRSVMEVEAYRLHLMLSQILGSTLWNRLEIKLYDQMCKKFYIKKTTLQGKFTRLTRKNSELFPTTDTDEVDSVMNLSNYHLSSVEMDILKKGWKTCHTFSNNVEEYIVDVECAASKVNYNLKNAFKNECLPILHRLSNMKHKSNQASKCLKNLREKDLIITKADKGNVIVIMNKEDYIDRTEKMLEDTVYQKINKSPLNKCVSEVNEVLKTIKLIIPETDMRWLKVSNPKVAKLYTFPKIHKPGEKMRPIVSQINAPTSKIEKWLLNRFNMFGEVESYSLKNSHEFADEIKDIKIADDEILVSFDVTAMFPSIPIGKTVELLRNWLKKWGLEKMKIDEYVKLTELCMRQKFFQFNGKFYLQKDGVTMGGSLSGFLANLFMSDLEIKVCNQHHQIFLYWRRYVDDIFSKIKKDRRIESLEILNAQDDSVKFTIEEEQDSKLPFLDVEVIRVKGSLEIDIYRKSTHVDSYIHNRSYNPPAHKYAIFNSLIHRMVTLPLTEDRRAKEWIRILEVARKNGFYERDIWRIRKRKEYKARINETTTLTNTDEDKKFAAITYHPQLANNFKKVFRKYGLQAASVNKCSTRAIFHPKLKDTTPDEEKSGIYRISCNDCEKVYIGQTKRTIRKRGSEHRRNSLNHEIGKSAVAKHFWEEGHDINFVPELIKNVQGYNKLNIHENIEMYKAQHRLMNVDPENLNNPLFDAIDSRGKTSKLIQNDKGKTCAEAGKRQHQSPTQHEPVAEQVTGSRYALRKRSGRP